MGFLLKPLLWIGVVVLPGGLLLLPVIYALHRSERRRADDREGVTQGRAQASHSD